MYNVHSTEDFLKPVKNWFIFSLFFLSCTSEIFQNFEYNCKSVRSQQARWQIELQAERGGLVGKGQPDSGLCMFLFASNYFLSVKAESIHICLIVTAEVMTLNMPICTD